MASLSKGRVKVGGMRKRESEGKEEKREKLLKGSLRGFNDKKWSFNEDSQGNSLD